MFISLREFQLKCVNEIDASKSGVLIASTGSGKTMMGAALAWRDINRGKKVAFVVPRDNLARQTAATFQKWMISPGFILGGEPENRSANAQIVSYQSLGSKKRDLKWMGDYDTWIVDECHTSAFAKSLGGFLRKCDRKIGLTATPWQMGQRSLLDVFDDVFFAPPAGKLIEMGYLARPIYFIPPNKGKLGASPEFIYTQWNKFATGEKTFVFCNNINQSEAVAHWFRECGVKAISVTSTTPLKQVEASFAAFKSGVIKVLVSCNKLAEGCDIPDATCVVLANRSDSMSGVIQRIGRGARIAYQKRTFKVIDCVGVVKKFGRFEEIIVSKEDLLKEEPKEGKIPFKICSICNCNNYPTAKVCVNCGHIFEFELVPYDAPGELQRFTRNDIEARALAAFHRFMLEEFKQKSTTCEKLFLNCYNYYPPDHWVVDAILPDSMRSQAVDLAWQLFKQKVAERLPREPVQLSLPFKL